MGLVFSKDIVFKICNYLIKKDVDALSLTCVKLYNWVLDYKFKNYYLNISKSHATQEQIELFSHFDIYNPNGLKKVKNLDKKDLYLYIDGFKLNQKSVIPKNTKSLILHSINNVLHVPSFVIDVKIKYYDNIELNFSKGITYFITILDVYFTKNVSIQYLPNSLKYLKLESIHRINIIYLPPNLETLIVRGYRDEIECNLPEALRYFFLYHGFIKNHELHEGLVFLEVQHNLSILSYTKLPSSLKKIKINDSMEIDDFNLDILPDTIEHLYLPKDTKNFIDNLLERPNLNVYIDGIKQKKKSKQLWKKIKR